MTMRCAAIIAAYAAVAGGMHAGIVHAAAPQADPKATTSGNGYTYPLSSADMEKIHDLSKAERARAMAESGKLISTLQLSCQPTDAARVGHGKFTADGKTVEVNAYEVVCSNGMGYILATQGSQKPIATSCFAAEATHAAGIVQGESDIYCQFAANKNVKATASSLMTATGTPCAVGSFRWFGFSASSQTEYSEVACADGKGYLLKMPRSGAAVSVLSCQEAAKQGLKCRLTDSGPVAAAATMQTFRDALKQNGVHCEPTQMRTIGRESVDKRYVVEVQCPEQPNGLVAYIPLEGNTNPFETIDCPAAVERQIHCQYPAR
jgi:hypothetical protein